MQVDMGMENGGKRNVQDDILKKKIDMKWIGWRKGEGIKEKEKFDIVENSERGEFEIRNMVF